MAVGLPNTYSEPKDRFLPDLSQQGLNYGIVEIFPDFRNISNTQIQFNIMTVNSPVPAIKKQISFAEITPNPEIKIPNCEYKRLSPQYRWFAHFFNGVFVDWSPLSWKIFIFLSSLFIGVPILSIWLAFKILTTIFCRRRSSNKNK